MVKKSFIACLFPGKTLTCNLNSGFTQSLKHPAQRKRNRSLCVFTYCPGLRGCLFTKRFRLGLRVHTGAAPGAEAQPHGGRQFACRMQGGSSRDEQGPRSQCSSRRLTGPPPHAAPSSASGRQMLSRKSRSYWPSWSTSGSRNRPHITLLLTQEHSPTPWETNSQKWQTFAESEWKMQITRQRVRLMGPQMTKSGSELAYSPARCVAWGKSADHWTTQFPHL